MSRQTNTAREATRKKYGSASHILFSPDWVLADEVYGSDSKFRNFLEERGQAYVLAVSSQQRLWVGFSQKRVDAISRELAVEDWHRLSAGGGTKGPRLYDWAGGQFGAPTEQGLTKCLLLRRSVENPKEVAYYLCLAPADTTLQELARAAVNDGWLYPQPHTFGYGLPFPSKNF